MDNRTGAQLSPSLGSRIGWGAWCACVILFAAGFLLEGTAHTPRAENWPLGQATWVLAYMAFATVGAIIAAHRPTNAIAWLFCAFGLLEALSFVAARYANRVLGDASDPLAAGQWTVWLQSWLFAPAFLVLALVLQLFPDGRPLSRGWLRLTWLAVALTSAQVVGLLFRPGPLERTPPSGAIVNPAGIEALRGVTEVLSSWPGSPPVLFLLVSIVPLLLRMRRAAPRLRRQITWVVSACSLFVMTFVAMLVMGAAVPGFWSDGAKVFEVLLPLAFAGIPIAVGIAILRHRLWDIDRLVNRALVYSWLTLLLALVYWAGVVLLQLALGPLTQTADLAIVGATLAVAAAFLPARRWIQDLVDRRFYRSRYDAQRVLGLFGGRLRAQVDLRALTDDVLHTVQATVQPTGASLWLQDSDKRISQAGRLRRLQLTSANDRLAGSPSTWSVETEALQADTEATRTTARS